MHLVLIGLVSGVLSTLVYLYLATGFKTNEYREVMNEIRNQHRWALPAAVATSGSFITLDNVFNKVNKDVYLDTITEHLEAKVSTTFPSGESSDLAMVKFELESFLALYSLQRAHCEAEEAHSGKHSQCTARGRIPVAWQKQLHAIDHRYYLADNSMGELTLGRKQKYTHKICNLSFLPVEAATFTKTMTDVTVDLYASYLGQSLHPERVYYLGRLNPGTCVEDAVTGYDMRPHVATHIETTDNTMYTWLQKRLPQASNTVAPASLPKEAAGPNLCIPKDVFDEHPVNSQNCGSNRRLAQFQYTAVDLGDNRIRTVTQLPYYIIYDPFSYQEADEFQKVLNHIRIFSNVVQQEYSYEKTWRDQTPLFELGPRTHDPQQLALGVSYANFPTKNIYGDSQNHIPSSGSIIKVNGEKIYSEYGLWDALNRHGYDLKAGIKDPVRLDIETCVSDTCTLYAVYAGLRLNPKAQLPVNTEYAVGTTFAKSIALNSAGLTCAGGNTLKVFGNILNAIFDSKHRYQLHKLDQCTWELELAEAYVYQNRYSDAQFASTAGAFLTPLSILARTKTVSKLLKISKRSPKRLIALSTIEAAEGVVWELNGKTPLSPLPPEYLGQIASYGFGLSFVVNAALDSKK